MPYNMAASLTVLIPGIADYNECNDPVFDLVCVCAAGLSANCQATCVNTVGSFECSCNGPEFTLDPATAECIS